MSVIVALLALRHSASSMPPPRHPSRPSRAAGRQHREPSAAYNATKAYNASVAELEDDEVPYTSPIPTMLLAPIPAAGREYTDSVNAKNRTKAPQLQNAWWDLFAATGPVILKKLTEGISFAAPDELRYLTNDGNFHLLPPSKLSGLELALATAATVIPSYIERIKFNKDQTAKYVEAVIKQGQQQHKDFYIDVPKIRNGMNTEQNEVVRDMEEQLKHDPRVAKYSFIETGPDGHSKWLVVPTSSKEASKPVKRGRGRGRGM